MGPGEMGPDALDPALTLEAWRGRIRRHPGELKNLLRNQAFVAGIGNAYSDEILHAARLLPFRKRSTLAPEEVDELYAAMRTTLQGAVELLRERVPPTFEKQVRDPSRGPQRAASHVPVRTRITRVTGGGFPTGFCRGCRPELAGTAPTTPGLRGSQHLARRIHVARRSVGRPDRLDRRPETAPRCRSACHPTCTVYWRAAAVGSGLAVGAALGDGTAAVALGARTGPLEGLARTGLGRCPGVGEVGVPGTGTAPPASRSPMASG